MTWHRIKRRGQRARDRVEWQTPDGRYRVLRIAAVQGVRLEQPVYHAAFRARSYVGQPYWDRVSGRTPRTYHTEQAAKRACEQHTVTGEAV